jgi:dimethylamine/trimethylamine dehydrogenase
MQGLNSAIPATVVFVAASSCHPARCFPSRPFGRTTTWPVVVLAWAGDSEDPAMEGNPFMRDPRYDILFEPVKIGPVTTRNRFYQVPHCTGMGYRYPDAEAALRGIKAEGGWGVVSTQETEIHPTSDLSPFNEARIWDDADIPALRKLTDAVHAHGSLAALELVHNGLHAANRYSRMGSIGPSDTVVDMADPVQARAMDKTDILNFRRWHRSAAVRGKRAGFDIIYVYAGHDMTLLQHFLSRWHNHRSDEYGGSFENRLRLFREVIADTKDAVGDTCAVAVRFSVDELIGPQGLTSEGEGRDVIAALAEEPDLWDVTLSDWSNDSQTSRFSQEGFQEPHIAFVKSLTSKPVVGVGRYTSPDSMVRVIRKGLMDLVGAARPSIADPFLPLKIEQGRIDDIRECIGCNICTIGDNTCVPMRCTQNPTMGEEYRKGWHPESMPPAGKSEPVLVVGGGPAGLEAARALAQRGVPVVLAEAGAEWGGRVTRESRLPGLAAWARVRDWRIGQLHNLPNAEIYLSSRLTADDILSYDMPHIALATGATWRTDGLGRTHHLPLEFIGNGTIVSPDSLMDAEPQAADIAGPVVVFDDDGFYLAGVLAERLAETGLETHFVTPAAVVSPWSEHTLEQARIQTRLIERGITIHPLHKLAGRGPDSLMLEYVYSGITTEIACGTLVLVTARVPNAVLWHELSARRSEWADAGIRSVRRIGDCLSPGLIATANYAGHEYARSYGVEIDPDVVPFVRDDIAALNTAV